MVLSRYLLSLCTVLAVAFPSNLYAAPVKKLVKATQNALFTPMANSLHKLEDEHKELQTKRQEVNAANSSVQQSLNEAKDTHSRNEANLDEQLSNLSELQTIAIALSGIVPHQESLLQITTNFLREAGLEPSAEAIGGYFIDSRNAQAQCKTILSAELDNLNRMRFFHEQQLKRNINELNALAQGSYGQVAPYGFDYYVQKTIEDLNNELSIIESTQPFVDNHSFSGTTQNPLKRGSSSVIPSLLEHSEHLVNLIQQADGSDPNGNPISQQQFDSNEYNSFRDLVDTHILDFFNGDENNPLFSQIGMVEHWRAGKASALRQVENLNRDIADAVNNGSLGLAQVIAVNRDRLAREARFFDFQSEFIMAHHRQQLTKLMNSSQALTNFSRSANQSTPKPWKKAITACARDLNQVAGLHSIVFETFHELVAVAQTEFTSLNTSFNNKTEEQAAASEVSEKFQAIVSGGLTRMQQQIDSSKRAMDLLSQQISSGASPLADAMNVWEASTTAKRDQYQYDQIVAIPNEMRASQDQISELRTLFNASLSRIVKLTEKQEDLTEQLPAFETATRLLDRFFAEKRYDAIYDEVVASLVNVLGGNKRAQKGLKKLQKKLAKKAGKSALNAKKPRAIFRGGKAAINDFLQILSPLTSDISGVINESSKPIVADPDKRGVVDLINEAKYLSTEITKEIK